MRCLLDRHEVRASRGSAIGPSSRRCELARTDGASHALGANPAGRRRATGFCSLLPCSVLRGAARPGYMRASPATNAGQGDRPDRPSAPAARASANGAAFPSQSKTDVERHSPELPEPARLPAHPRLDRQLQQPLDHPQDSPPRLPEFAQYVLSTQPFESCLLYAGTPIDFEDSEVRLADMPPSELVRA